MSKVTVSQAAALTGKSRETINKATRAGTLSFSRNSSNHKVIDVAELERVHPLIKTLDELKQSSKAVKASQVVSEPDTNAEFAALREKLANSERTNEMLSAERERERHQLQDEIDNLRASLEKIQEQHGKAMLLITDQSKQTKDRIGDWEEAIRNFDNRLAEHERRAKKEQDEIKENAKRKIARLQRALEEEQSKSFMQRLFG